MISYGFRNRFGLLELRFWIFFLAFFLGTAYLYLQQFGTGIRYFAFCMVLATFGHVRLPCCMVFAAFWHFNLSFA